MTKLAKPQVKPQYSSFPDVLHYVLHHWETMGQYPSLVCVDNKSYVKIRESLRQTRKNKQGYACSIQQAIFPARVDLRIWVQAQFKQLPTQDELRIQSYKEFSDYLYDHQFQMGFRPEAIALKHEDIEAIIDSIPKDAVTQGNPKYTKGARVVLEGVELVCLEIGTRQGHIGVMTIFEDPDRVLSG